MNFTPKREGAKTRKVELRHYSRKTDIRRGRHEKSRCQVISLVAPIILAFTLHPGPKPVYAIDSPPAALARSKGDLITLERTACFGACPMYTVTIASNGRVTFEGRRFTKVSGIAHGKITGKAFRRLVKEFEAINYFSLPDRYTPGTPDCPRMITDLPSANTSLRLRGKLKTVMQYHGCGDEGVL